MKKILGLFFISFSLLFCSNIICAAVISSGTVGTVDIVADFSNMGSVDFSFELRNIADDQTIDTINWKIQDVTLRQDSPQWKWSTTYAVVKATVTDPTVSYYLYQKNTESTVYKSTAARIVQVYTSSVTFAYSGLVHQEKQGGDYGGYIALSYLFTENKLSSSELQQEYDPETMTEFGEKVARYFTDEADYIAYYNGTVLESDITSTEPNFKREYAVIACANTGGLVFGPYAEDGSFAPWAPDAVRQSKTAYMYFGGNFMNIFRGDIFGTDKIVIEKVVE